MEGLRVADLHRITTFLTNLYDFADIGRFRRRLLTTLPALVPADRVSVIESNPQLRQAAGESLPSGAFNGELQRVYGQYIPQSPFIQAYKRGQGSAVVLARCSHRMYPAILAPAAFKLSVSGVFRGRPQARRGDRVSGT
jgi:hypothetical protein